MQVFTLLTILLLGTACNGRVKKDLPKEKDDSKLIKKIENGIVQRFLQDKSGNLWFGTTDNGLYKYDGKSFNNLQ
jgi:ligand-binding sensor domain-containing protein